MSRKMVYSHSSIVEMMRRAVLPRSRPGSAARRGSLRHGSKSGACRDKDHGKTVILLRRAIFGAVAKARLHGTEEVTTARGWSASSILYRLQYFLLRAHLEEQCFTKKTYRTRSGGGALTHFFFGFFGALPAILRFRTSQVTPSCSVLSVIPQPHVGCGRSLRVGR